MVCSLVEQKWRFTAQQILFKTVSVNSIRHAVSLSRVLQTPRFQVYIGILDLGIPHYQGAIIAVLGPILDLLQHLAVLRLTSTDLARANYFALSTAFSTSVERVMNMAPFKSLVLVNWVFPTYTAIPHVNRVIELELHCCELRGRFLVEDTSRGISKMRIGNLGLYACSALTEFQRWIANFTLTASVTISGVESLTWLQPVSLRGLVGFELHLDEAHEYFSFDVLDQLDCRFISLEFAIGPESYHGLLTMVCQYLAKLQLRPGTLLRLCVLAGPQLMRIPQLCLCTGWEVIEGAVKANDLIEVVALKSLDEEDLHSLTIVMGATHI
ncbi:hypothetical protein DFH07DRAFT_1001668 [Mycena maculata]|uniref:Uncharacterized protein n=1 Tax=Mycena maculata TaxID=230809 RepID=A0AAD7HR27_9AGAR|nr:hypothetical protein DFH07DRAFT_1001668 [Mycena maculata]